MHLRSYYREDLPLAWFKDNQAMDLIDPARPTEKPSEPCKDRGLLLQVWVESTRRLVFSWGSPYYTDNTPIENSVTPGPMDENGRWTDITSKEEIGSISSKGKVDQQFNATLASFYSIFGYDYSSKVLVNVIRRLIVMRHAIKSGVMDGKTIEQMFRIFSTEGSEYRIFDTRIDSSSTIALYRRLFSRMVVNVDLEIVELADKMDTLMSEFMTTMDTDFEGVNRPCMNLFSPGVFIENLDFLDKLFTPFIVLFEIVIRLLNMLDVDHDKTVIVDSDYITRFLSVDKFYTLDAFTAIMMRTKRHLYLDINDNSARFTSVRLFDENVPEKGDGYRVTLINPTKILITFDNLISEVHRSGESIILRDSSGHTFSIIHKHNQWTLPENLNYRFTIPKNNIRKAFGSSNRVFVLTNDGRVSFTTNIDEDANENLGKLEFVTLSENKLEFTSPDGKKVADMYISPNEEHIVLLDTSGRVWLYTTNYQAIMDDMSDPPAGFDFTTPVYMGLPVEAGDVRQIILGDESLMIVTTNSVLRGGAMSPEFGGFNCLVPIGDIRTYGSPNRVVYNHDTGSFIVEIVSDIGKKMCGYIKTRKLNSTENDINIIEPLQNRVFRATPISDIEVELFANDGIHPDKTLRINMVGGSDTISYPTYVVDRDYYDEITITRSLVHGSNVRSSIQSEYPDRNVRYFDHTWLGIVSSHIVDILLTLRSADFISEDGKNEMTSTSRFIRSLTSICSVNEMMSLQHILDRVVDTSWKNADGTSLRDNMLKNLNNAMVWYEMLDLCRIRVLANRRIEMAYGADFSSVLVMMLWIGILAESMDGVRTADILHGASSLAKRATFNTKLLPEDITNYVKSSMNNVHRAS